MTRMGIKALLFDLGGVLIQLGGITEMMGWTGELVVASVKEGMVWVFIDKMTPKFTVPEPKKQGGSR